MKSISIVSPTFNEVDNVEELCFRIELVMSNTKYDYEIIFIDNASTDGTVAKLKELAKKNKHIKIIVNARNFGHIRSPYYGLLQAKGDAVVFLASDLQDPPELINDFLAQWEEGNKVVMAVKTTADESFPLKTIRKIYYRFLGRISDAPLLSNATGCGLYDQSVIAELRKLNEPYPYFRGLVVELGFPIKKIDFHQPIRQAGKTKNNLKTLFDMALLGIVTHSQSPIRFLTIFGLVTSFLSLVIAFGYAIAKVIYWNEFSLGQAPLLIGVFFFGSTQLFMIGMLGEYLGNILRRQRNMPLVVEQERHNFGD